MTDPRGSAREWDHRRLVIVAGIVFIAIWIGGGLVSAQDDEFEPIDSSACANCHEASRQGSVVAEDISHSVHEGLECLDCHQDRGTVPHREGVQTFEVGSQGCRTCHEGASQNYQVHGRAKLGTSENMPRCSDCHGDHDILPSTAKRSAVHPTNLPETCGKCHENLDITTKYDILIDHPIQIYARSVHGQATRGGVYVAASCNDCHSSGGSAHKILSPGAQDSSINHFNIPRTCGQCHKGVESDYREGIHGQLVARGETDSPVCTDCHGEHGILSPDDPLSPVSGSKVAEMTCSPCHESAVLNEKYGIKTGRLTTFIDSYHGLKSKAGDTHVANCASCHGVHRILPASDPTSTVNPANLQHTCGECHPSISEAMASTPIHGIGGQGLRTPVADVVEKIYIIAITVIIGLMILHWVIDLFRHLINTAKQRPQILRMHIDEVVQHALLAITFIVLVISGFALRYDQGFMARSSLAGRAVSRSAASSTGQRRWRSWGSSSGTSSSSFRRAGGPSQKTCGRSAATSGSSCGACSTTSVSGPAWSASNASTTWRRRSTGRWCGAPWSWSSPDSCCGSTTGSSSSSPKASSTSHWSSISGKPGSPLWPSSFGTSTR